MTEFTKEQLELIQSDTGQPLYYQLLAAFALSQMERAENAEAERDRLIEDRWTLPLDELVYGTRAMHEVVDLRVERDRLKKELEAKNAKLRAEILAPTLIDMGNHYELGYADGERLEQAQNDAARAEVKP